MVDSVEEPVGKCGSDPTDNVLIDDINSNADLSDVREYGLEIVNIVGTLDTGRKFDLNLLSDVLPQAEYHPENSPFLVYQDTDSATLLVPSNGVLSIVGAKDIDQTQNTVSSFFERLDQLGIDVSRSPESIVVQNIVARGDLETELDLDVLSIDLGLERCEYDPENFPGIVFRANKDATVLIFRTGKLLVTGADSYGLVINTARGLYEELGEMGVENTPSYPE